MKKPMFILVLTLSFFSAHAGNQARLEYIRNQGQWEDPSIFHADLKGGRLFLESRGATFLYLDPSGPGQASHRIARGTTMAAHAYRISYEGAAIPSSIEAFDSTQTVYNYFLGNDPARWASGLHACRSVIAKEIYPGIDIRYSSDGPDFKSDWIVQPGGNTSLIQIRYDGVQPVLLEDGNLLLQMSIGQAVEQKPVAWQGEGEYRRPVNCRFAVNGQVVSFIFPDGYDNRSELVIDPTLVFSTYSGSLADNWGFTATYDASGNAISGGNVNAFGYPVTTGAVQMTYGGGGIGGNAWSCDMAIIKFNASGTALVFATYLGGIDNEEPHSIVVNGNNEIGILGLTFSSNYPVASNAYDNTYNGGGDIVVTSLNATGTSMLGSTFMGGTGSDGTNISFDFNIQLSLKFNYGDDARGEIISDPSNDFIIACVTQSTDFPVTAGVMQNSFGGGLQDGVIFSLDNNLGSLHWSTYFGGSGDDACYDILRDSVGGFYVGGGTQSNDLPVTTGAYQATLNGGSIDGYILHINNNATAVLQCTYVGTSGPDQVYFVEQDRPGDIYVLGQTGGIYPISPGVYSVPNSGQFIQKFTPQLSASIFSTTFGTGTPTPNICPTAFMIDTCMNIYAAGWGRCINMGGVFGPSSTTGLPLTPDAIQPTTDGCDFYFIILNANANSLLYATFFGGALSQEHVDGGTSRFDRNGVIYESVCAGCGGNSDFPTQPGVVSQTNNSPNCNNAVIKFDLLLSSAQVVAQATPTNIGCAPFTVQFYGTISPGATGYYWDFGDGSPTVSILNPIYTYQSPGIYRAALYAFGTCRSDSAFVTVRADTLTTAGFTWEKEPCLPEVRYTNTSTDASAYLWHFGDGDTSSMEHPVHQYDSSGMYTVLLVANPGSLCSDSAIALVNYSVVDTSSFFIPNVFTPNGDGKNDLFRITGITNCSDFHCTVYNRWGKKVFESSESTLYWDGTIGSSDAASGVYYYLVELDGKEFNGHVSLLRE